MSCIIICMIIVVRIVCFDKLINYWRCMKISIYGCCGILWAIGILIILIAIGFTLSNPSVVYTC